MTDHIRPATPDDYPAYSVLFRELGVDDPTPSAERFAADLVPRTLIYERDGAVIGYVCYNNLAGRGYIQNLVVSPGTRGGRIGEALMIAAAGALRAWGVTGEWNLNVKVDNAAAIRLYERLGLRAVYPMTVLRVAWANLDRLPVDAAPVTIAPVCDDDIDALERVLGLLAGRLRLARSRPGRTTLQLRDGQGAPAGVACLDPAVGAFPFAVVRPGLAAPLLRGLAPHARSGDPALSVVIEHDDALSRALIAAGAEVRLRLVHYAGPLPPAALGRA
jgi:GNAT superfamily N-acetyltransferase